MVLVDEIRKLAESKLAESQFIVEVMISAKHGPKKVLVIIDSDRGITIDECAEISRQLSKSLDEGNILEDNYLLEVSTPGVDHPLTLKRQYNKNIGRSLKVKLPDTTIEGKLIEVHDDKVMLSQEIGIGKMKESKIVEVPFSAIEKAFVLVSFK